MPEVSARTDADTRPVIYAGGFADQVANADLPDDCIVLGEQDARTHELAGVLDHANTLVLLDVLSFPVESMTGAHWDVPMVVVLPPGFDAETLANTLGPPLLEHLGFFDRIVTPNSPLWEKLRRKCSWAEGQHVPVASNDPGEVAAKVCSLLGAQSASSTIPEAEGIDRDLHSSKVLHRVQARVLGPRFAAARGKRDAGIPLDVLEVGAGVGRWASSFDLTETKFVGIDGREDLVEIARANFPEQRFDLLGSDLISPCEDESFDLVFSVTVMHYYPAPAKRTLLSEMWRVTRPGGHLLFLEDFVFTREPEKPAVHPMSVREFEGLILAATAGRVVLDYVEALRYPGEDLHRGGLISLSRLGLPRT